jgi:type IX secretion system PorP/SprF family membrane protein
VKRIQFYLLILSFGCGLSSPAQVDHHFSQFYAYPLWLNPSMAGVMDGDYRITAMYRDQWSNVMVPFTSVGLSADFTTNKNIALGVSFMNQTAGEGGYRFLNAYGTVVYNGIRFGADKNQIISIGLQGGFFTRNFDRSKFQFGDQWNPVSGYDPGTATGDIISLKSSTIFDAGAGISYADGRFDRKVNLFAGVAAFHLTEPVESFVTAGSVNTKAFVPRRYVAHAGARIQVNDNLSVTPNVLFMKQGTAQEKMLGVFGQVRANDYTDVMIGMNYRFRDAISPYVGIAFQGFMVGASYDVNNSDLGKSVTGTNSFEISLTYIGRRSGKPLRYLSCPRF